MGIQENISKFIVVTECTDDLVVLDAGPSAHFIINVITYTYPCGN